MFKKTIYAAAAALTVGIGAIAATPSPAAADYTSGYIGAAYYGYGYGCGYYQRCYRPYYYRPYYYRPHYYGYYPRYYQHYYGYYPRYYGNQGYGGY
jgi:hypothetical protein